MIAIIDYKMGNVRSVAKAFESIGAKVTLTANKNKLRTAKALVLPGVGAYSAGMKNLRKLKLIPEIQKAVNEGKPLLGICLGLQLLFTMSEEHGRHMGLNLIPGEVVRFKSNLKIPHMGWNTITQVKRKKLEEKGKRQKISGTELLKGIPDGSYFYFVHSYYVKPVKRQYILAQCHYGRNFTCVAGKGNIYGIQFHPEKSSDLGLKIVRNFCRICGEVV
ncbi:MAG: imidazole glycerol phosphate synthase subunit HisH [Candidatus Omnitrophica bacterium]|nr:imidazole glycerol phosphate synthase subunit HisH [Candidatus Omnitrophota bacterium]